MEKLRAVIYIRVSDPSQIENNSLETQLISCRRYAEQNNLEVVEVYREEGVSAKHLFSRPEMKKLLEFCTLKKNRISRVIVYKMDRWTRNVEEGLMAISLLAKNGTVVIPATEIAEQTPMGKAMRTILMAFGEMDNNIKSERVADNLRTKFRSGQWCWKAPIGYMRPKESKEERKGKPAIIDEKLGPILKQMFNVASEKPISKISLANYVNSLGFEKAYGKKADGKLVKHIIENTFYYGNMYAPKWEEYQLGKHEKLVEQSIWDRVYYNVLGKKRGYKHHDDSLSPLKGILLCSTCNHPMTTSHSKGGGGTHYHSHECHNKKCTHQERIQVAQAHTQFEKILKTLKPSEPTLKLFNYLVFNEWDKSIEQLKNEVKLREKTIQDIEDQITQIGLSKLFTDEEKKNSFGQIKDRPYNTKN